MSDYYLNSEDDDYQEPYYAHTKSRQSSRHSNQENNQQNIHHKPHHDYRQRSPSYCDDARDVDIREPITQSGKPSRRDVDYKERPPGTRLRSHSSNHVTFQDYDGSDDDNHHFDQQYARRPIHRSNTLQGPRKNRTSRTQDVIPAAFQNYDGSDDDNIHLNQQYARKPIQRSNTLQGPRKKRAPRTQDVIPAAFQSYDGSDDDNIHLDQQYVRRPIQKSNTLQGPRKNRAPRTQDVIPAAFQNYDGSNDDNTHLDQQYDRRPIQKSNTLQGPRKNRAPRTQDVIPAAFQNYDGSDDNNTHLDQQYTRRPIQKSKTFQGPRKNRAPRTQDVIPAAFQNYDGSDDDNTRLDQQYARRPIQKSNTLRGPRKNRAPRTQDVIPVAFQNYDGSDDDNTHLDQQYARRPIQKSNTLQGPRKNRAPRTQDVSPATFQNYDGIDGDNIYLDQQYAQRPIHRSNTLQGPRKNRAPKTRDAIPAAFHHYDNCDDDNAHFDQQYIQIPIHRSDTLQGPRKNRLPKTQDVLPQELVDILTNFRDFKASLLTLHEKFHLQPTVIRDITSHNPQTFAENREFVELRPQLSVCHYHTGPSGCRFKDTCNRLHICHDYATGTCKSDSCLFGHNLETGHNRSILLKLHLDSISKDILLELVENVTETRKPKYPLDICFNYNNLKCPFKTCKRLHLCLSFVANAGRCTKSMCQLNHNPKEQLCQQLLKSHGIRTDESPRDIVAALIAANPKVIRAISSLRHLKTNTQQSSHHDNSSSVPSSRKSKSLQNLNTDNKAKTHWYNHLKGDVAIPEICYQSVESSCKNENSGCSRLHAMQHFHWQISENGKSWFNLRQPQVTCLELAFCDPSQDGISLPRLDPSTLNSSTQGLFTLMGRDVWKADFQSMDLHSSSQNKTLTLRRLCTEDTQQKSLKENTYLWYFMDVNQRWIQYGEVDSTQDDDRRSSTSSVNIEKKYCQNRSVPMTFWTAEFHYILDFTKMIQVNQHTDVTRKVRRRPKPHLRQQQRDFPNSKPASPQSRWSYHLKGDVKIPEICFYSVESTCKYESIGCQRLHAKLHYHWQLCGKDNSWFNLQPAQVTGLEFAFCDPAEDGVNLPQLDYSKLESSNGGLGSQLGRDSWKATFHSMKVSNSSQSETFQLRRLCTQDVPEKYIKESSYYWYFRDKNKNWIQYGQYDSTKQVDMISSVSSNDVEKGFRRNPYTQVNFHTRCFQYVLDVSNMTQINQMNKKSREVRRRPKPHLKDSSTKLPSHWKTMAPSEVLRVVHLSQSTKEYQNVEGLLKGQLPNVKVLQIGRIQNPKLWIAFENNTQPMKNLPNKSIQQLFHGTRHDLVAKICYDNFDYQTSSSSSAQPTLRRVSLLQQAHARQTNSGNINFSFGAADAYKFCQSNSKSFSYLFVAKVIIDSTTTNKAFMGSPFVPTFLASFAGPPTCISKIDNKEVYPEYVIKLSGPASTTKPC